MAFGPKTKTPEQLAERRQRVSEMYLECQSMADIGRQLGVSAQTIYKDICWAREQWRTRAADAIEVLKQRELAKIDHLEVEAWRGWLRSTGRTVIVKHDTGSGTLGRGELGQIDKTSETVEYKAGDPRFLEIIKGCIESRRKILGIDAPARSSIENPDGTPLLTGVRVIEVGSAAS